MSSVVPSGPLLFRLIAPSPAVFAERAERIGLAHELERRVRGCRPGVIQEEVVETVDQGIVGLDVRGVQHHVHVNPVRVHETVGQRQRTERVSGAAGGRVGDDAVETERDLARLRLTGEREAADKSGASDKAQPCGVEERLRVRHEVVPRTGERRCDYSIAGSCAQ